MDDASSLIVPAEWVINEDIGVPAPEPSTPALRTRLNPEGKVPSSDADFGISLRGGARQNTIAGAASEAADIAALRANPGSVLAEDERAALERAMQSESEVQRAVARKALARKEKAGTLAPSRQQEAQDAIAEQLAYEHSGAFQSAAGVAGTVLGTVASPENMGGLAGVLVRRFPALAGRPVATAALDAALTNTLTDPVVQGIRTTSGGQDEYSVAQTALAPVVGGLAGGALAGGARLAEKGLERVAARSGPPLPDASLSPAERAANELAAGQAFDPSRAQEQMAAPAVRPSVGPIAEPPVPEGFVRVYHSGAAGDGEFGRWVSTDRTYASNYRSDLPLFYLDIPKEDPRVRDPDYPEQDGLTRNFETTPQEAAKFQEISRAPASEPVKGNLREIAGNSETALPTISGEAKARFDAPVEQARQAAETIRQSPATAIPTYAPGSAAAVEPNGPAGVFMFDAAALNTDAKRFQYKDNGDEQGVTTALKSVSKWDAAKANQVIVWEQADGTLFVVDGHQRSGLARRLIEQGKESQISLPGILYREADGVSAEDVRAIAAAKNIAEGSGSALDGAKVLRSRPELLDGSIPLTDRKGKQAANLARLDDEPFRMVINEVVPENQGAIVGELIPNDAARQTAAMKAIARFEPRNETETTALVQRVVQSEVAKSESGAQASMFGDLESADSTAGEEMKIVARAIAELKKDKALFSRVTENAARLEAEGSVIARDKAASVAQDSEAFAKLVSSNAYSAGPIRDALTTAAKEVKNGSKSVNDAASGLLAAVRREVEADVSARSGNRGSRERAATERGADGKPQSIIPGAERASDAALAQRGADAGLKPKAVQDFDTSGLALFGDAKNQTELFRRGRPVNPIQTVPEQIVKGRPIADNGTAEAAAKVQRIEDLGRTLIEGFQSIARQGRVTPGAQGIFKIGSGVIRVRQISDFHTLAHEVGHDLHIGSGIKSDIDGLVAKNVKELAGLGAGQGPKENAEAFAEFFSSWVSNRPWAEKNFPGATADLERILAEKFPDALKSVEAIRASLDAIRRAPSEAVVSADQISKQPPNFGDRFRKAVERDIDPQGRTVFSIMDALYTATIDKFHPVLQAVKSLSDTAKENGVHLDLKPTEDAYIMARMMPGSHGAADTMLKHGVIAVGDISPSGASLASGIEKALGKKFTHEQFNDFSAYLIARRMVAEYDRMFNGELARDPGKFSLGDYQQAVANFEAKYPAFIEGAKDVYEFQRNHLTRLFNKGMVSKEFFDAASKRVDYVPLMRDMSDFAGEATKMPGMGAGQTLAYSVAKRFKGSDRTPLNALESIFKRVHDLEYSIALNDTVGALARLQEKAGPGSGYIIEPIPNHQMKSQKVDLIEALKAAGKRDGVDDADLAQLILQVEDHFGDSTWATLFSQQPITEGKEPIIFHWVNGERRAYRLGDKRLGRELHHALTAMSDMERNWFVSTLQIGQMILRAGVTRAVDFPVVNFVRDQFTSALTGGRRNIPFLTAAKGMYDAIKDTPEAIRYTGGGGIAGGAIVTSIEHSSFGKDVQSLTHTNILGKLAHVFELSEAGTRIGLYKSYFEQARELGMDVENAHTWAVFRANDYIDFRKHGSSFGILRRVIPFINAHLQGTDKEIRSLVDLKLEAKRANGSLSKTELDRLSDARVALIRLTSMGIVLGAGLAFMNADNPRWTNAPKYARDNNFLFSIGGQDFSVPKGFGVVQTTINAFERAAEYSMRRDPQIAWDFMSAASHAFAPPTSSPFISVPYDLNANYDSFRERAIVPYYMQGWEKPEQYNAYTSMLARQVAQATKAVGLDYSPMKIDYALQNLGGGMAKDILGAWDSLMGAQKPEKQIYDYPVLRRFVKNLDRGSQAERAFYDYVGNTTGRLEQVENAYAGKIRNGERQAAADYLRNLNEDERAWVTLNTQGFSANEKRLHPLYNARERISVINGLIRQLTVDNVIKESDLDRTNMTVSRRDAQPIKVDAKQRAELIEELQSLSVMTARNAMVAVGAKGTTGLLPMDPTIVSRRFRQYSPEIAAEFDSRIQKKNLPDFREAVSAWPQMKARLLKDGENADLTDLIPPDMKTRARRAARR